MASSDTQICNIALGQIGVGRIADIEGTTQVERDCKAIYSDARDEVLSDYDWAFARKKVELARLSSDPPFGFDYAYALPSDCISPRNLYGRGTRFEIVGDQLHCDLETDCYLTYTARITNPVLFPSKFVTALSHRLAAYLSATVKKNHKMAMEWWDTYYALLPVLEASSAGKADDIEPPENNTYVDAR